MSAKVAKNQAEKAGFHPYTSGSLHEPMEAGTTVEGNIRERMEKEDGEK